MLYLVRGLPGSGKTTLAHTLAMVVCSADDYFVKDGSYNFDPKKLPQAHADCQKRTRNNLTFGLHVAVANTFTQRWEMQPYLDMAKDLGVRVCVISVFDGGCTDEELTERNIHGVPCAAIQSMRERFEHDWRVGDTRPPWER